MRGGWKREKNTFLQHQVELFGPEDSSAITFFPFCSVERKSDMWEIRGYAPQKISINPKSFFSAKVEIRFILFVDSLKREKRLVGKIYGKLGAFF